MQKNPASPQKYISFCKNQKFTRPTIISKNRIYFSQRLQNCLFRVKKCLTKPAMSRNLGPFLPSRTRRTGKNRAIRGSAFRLYSSASLRNALRAPLLSLVQFKPSVFFTQKYHDCFKLKYLILHSAIASKITIIEKNLKKFAKPAKKS